MKVYLKKKTNLANLFWSSHRLLVLIDKEVYLPFGGKLPKWSSLVLGRPDLVRINRRTNEILMIQNIGNIVIDKKLKNKICESLKSEIIKLFGEKYNIKIIIININNE
jgi:hypothetical protein